MPRTKFLLPRGICCLLQDDFHQIVHLLPDELNGEVYIPAIGVENDTLSHSLPNQLFGLVPPETVLLRTVTRFELEPPVVVPVSVLIQGRKVEGRKSVDLQQPIQSSPLMNTGLLPS